jgi:hypothetical protein
MALTFNLYVTVLSLKTSHYKNSHPWRLYKNLVYDFQELVLDLLQVLTELLQQAQGIEYAIQESGTSCTTVLIADHPKKGKGPPQMTCMPCMECK